MSVGIEQKPDTTEPDTRVAGLRVDASSKGRAVFPYHFVYTAFLVAFCLHVFRSFFDRTADIPMAALIAMAMVAVYLNFRFWIGVWMLMLIQIHLFNSERPIREGNIGAIGDIIMVLGTMIFLFVSGRLTAVGKRLRRDSQPVRLEWKEGKIAWPSLASIWAQGIGQIRAMESWEALGADLAHGRRRTILPVLVALGVLLLNPPFPEAISEYRLTPAGLRTIKIGLFLAGLYFVLSAVLNGWSWRRLSRAQAEIYAKSTLLTWTHRDLRSVALRRIAGRGRVKSVGKPSIEKTP
ncbi:MAG: hypothetical protein KDA80_11125 [Planctomycetaceae bacterium]|nr:hypothetical protein [Planctomycetaceae bacterium]